LLHVYLNTPFSQILCPYTLVFALPSALRGPQDLEAFAAQQFISSQQQTRNRRKQEEAKLRLKATLGRPYRGLRWQGDDNIRE
jgi:hypothetical protein